MRGSMRGIRGRAPRRRVAACALGALVLMAGCAGPTGSRGAEPLRPAPAGTATGGQAPRWSMEPASWGKLDEIERWLDGSESQGASAYWRVEARLQLAEGRLAFAGPERNVNTNPDTLRYRRTAAAEAFAEILAAPEAATPDQLSRARRGARRVGDLGTTAARPASGPVALTGLVPRAQWNAAPADPRNMRRSAPRWRWITVHHSVFTSDGDSLAASLDTVQRIQRVHMDNEDYADIGYHYLIDRQGRVIEGRSLRWQGAHAGGTNNVGNVGICLLGNFEVERPTAAAIRSLERLIVELQRELSIPRRNVRPHRDWKETECPGRHLMPWFARFD